MKKLLIILSSAYPYRKSEDYLSNETNYINGFDKIICFPTTVYGNLSEQNITNYPPPPQHIIIKNSHYSFKQKALRNLIYTIQNKYFINELFSIIGRHLISKFKYLLRTSLQATHSYLDIEEIIKELEKKEKYEIYIYSYWMVNTALTAILLNKNKKLNIRKTFTRCHRFDVYEEANYSNYIPYRKCILSNMDNIYAISNDAKNYLEAKYPLYTANKITVSRLGTFDHGINISTKSSSLLRIVSCSWLRPVKRVHLILEALSTLKIPVEWTHFGDGEEMEQLKHNISKIKNKMLTVNFAGNISNSEILNAYKQKNYNIFINVSANEGVPVSIMEAMSFGKIIIATDVGGTSEIVTHKQNGYLLNKDFNITELQELIYTIYNMGEHDYMKMSEESRKIWEKKCNAKKNYELFYKEILKNEN